MTSRRAEGPRDAIWCRETVRSCGVRRDRATSRRAERPRDATLCRGIARRYSVQINCAIPETARRYVVQRDHVTPRRAEGPRALSRAERPRDATACRGKSYKLKSFCDRDIDRSTTGRFGPASGRTGHALPIPPHTRRRQTDSEYAECTKMVYLGEDDHLLLY